ncbi:hypothetical protein [uncultured Ruminococcus sp.]|uniref:hypothetical protein n=1 Tax=uncultured Ruminococcus sp. TaxID=165186 RepID=UPI0026702436|nr:hypothetical protein [uncultured Ruminococcus sp.]
MPSGKYACMATRYTLQMENRDLLGECMNAEMIIEKVRDSIENYEVFKDLALNIRSKKYMDKNI